MTHPDDKFTDEEVATVEQAATDAEARYQQRELDQRAAIREAVAAHKPGGQIATTESVDRMIKAAPDAWWNQPSPRRSFSLAGRFRVYFNRHQAAPLVWCVATDHLELAVAELVIEVPVRTVYAPKAAPDCEDGKPSAWLEVEGMLRIDASSRTARIE